MSTPPKRLDHQVIVGMVHEGSRVLDLGCDEGDLLERLRDEKKANVQGVELNQQAIYKCIAKGLSVVHSDLDSGLVGFPDQSFDYVILNQSLQEVRNIDLLLRESFRVARRTIVGFSNFGALTARWQLGVLGRAPVTGSLPYSWHDTPNLRFLTIRDFRHYCATHQIQVRRAVFLGRNHRTRLFPNLFADQAILELVAKK
ncbi:MAG: methionine biosynthesis protein MetW [Elusimicrobiota bacterium]|jgi:methionine biosynthesis protein MetW